MECIWLKNKFKLRKVCVVVIIYCVIIFGNNEKDICEDISCGNGGDCFDGNCTCQTGYVNIENFCEETCELEPCKELIVIKHQNWC